MNIKTSLLIGTLSCAASATIGLDKTTVSTDPVGVVTADLPATGFSYLGISLTTPTLLTSVNAKSASITFGYALMPYLSEESTFEALSAGHPFFLQGDYLKALKAVIKKLEVLLVKEWRRARKDPVKVLGRGGQSLKGSSSEHDEAGISEVSSEKEGEVKG